MYRQYAIIKFDYTRKVPENRHFSEKFIKFKN